MPHPSSCAVIRKGTFTDTLERCVWAGSVTGSASRVSHEKPFASRNGRRSLGRTSVWDSTRRVRVSIRSSDVAQQCHRLRAHCRPTDRDAQPRAGGCRVHSAFTRSRSACCSAGIRRADSSANAPSSSQPPGLPSTSCHAVLGSRSPSPRGVRRLGGGRPSGPGPRIPCACTARSQPSENCFSPNMSSGSTGGLSQVTGLPPRPGRAGSDQDVLVRGSVSTRRTLRRPGSPGGTPSRRGPPVVPSPDVGAYLRFGPHKSNATGFLGDGSQPRQVGPKSAPDLTIMSLQGHDVVPSVGARLGAGAPAALFAARARCLQSCTGERMQPPSRRAASWILRHEPIDALFRHAQEQSPPRRGASSPARDPDRGPRISRQVDGSTVALCRDALDIGTWRCDTHWRSAPRGARPAPARRRTESSERRKRRHASPRSQNFVFHASTLRFQSRHGHMCDKSRRTGFPHPFSVEPGSTEEKRGNETGARTTCADTAAFAGRSHGGLICLPVAREASGRQVSEWAGYGLSKWALNTSGATAEGRSPLDPGFSRRRGRVQNRILRDGQSVLGREPHIALHGSSQSPASTAFRASHCIVCVLGLMNRSSAEADGIPNRRLHVAGRSKAESARGDVLSSRNVVAQASTSADVGACVSSS